MLDKKGSLLNNLRIANRRLFEFLWSKKGPIDQALGESHEIAHFYQKLLRPPPNSPAELFRRNTQEGETIAGETKEFNELKEKIAEPTKYTDRNRFEFDKERFNELQIASLYRLHMFSPTTEPSDYEILNSVYGFEFLHEKEEKGDDYKAQMTSYFIYNRIFIIYREYIDKFPPPGAKLINDIYELNSYIFNLVQDIQVTFAKHALASLANLPFDPTGIYDETKINEQFHKLLLARVRDLLQKRTPSLGTTTDLKKMIMDEKLAPLIKYFRDHIEEELKLISAYVNYNQDPAVKLIRSLLNTANYLDQEQQDRIKMFLPLKHPRASFRDHINEVIRTDSKNADFANGVLALMNGDIDPQTFLTRYLDNFLTRFYKKEEKDIADKVTDFFSRPSSEPQQVFRLFYNDFKKQLHKPSLEDVLGGEKGKEKLDKPYS